MSTASEFMPKLFEFGFFAMGVIHACAAFWPSR